MISDKKDPVVLYLEGCIREDLLRRDSEALETDESLLTLYLDGLIKVMEENGEFLFSLTEKGKEIHLIETAERMQQSVVAEA